MNQTYVTVFFETPCIIKIIHVSLSLSLSLSLSDIPGAGAGAELDLHNGFSAEFSKLAQSLFDMTLLRLFSFPGMN